MNEQLSMRLMSMTYPNNFKVEAGQRIVQEIVIQNDGQVAWP